MSLLDELKSLRSRLSNDRLDDTATRKQLLEAAKDLVVALERPDDVIERVCYQLLETTCVKIAVEAGICKLLTSAPKALTAEEIAKNVSADATLIGRIMRCLSAWGAVTETEHGYLAATTSTTFADPRNEAAIETCFDLLAPAWLQLPNHLRSTKYQNPSDPKSTAFHKALGAAPGKVAPIELFFKSPHLQAFGLYMGTYTQDHISWVDLYPIQERLINGFVNDKDRAMIVDVGGGFGHQTQLLKKYFPQCPGRFIVQDLPGMKGPDIPGVEFMAHDFNTPQPIRGARCYYLRFVLHDYDDSRDLVILRRLRDAMEPGYSRLIINECIVPEKGASRFMTAADLNMMSLAAMERTEQQFRDLLATAGLQITTIYRARDGISESMIEAVVTDEVLATSF